MNGSGLSKRLYKRYLLTSSIIIAALLAGGAITGLGFLNQKSNFHIINVAGRQRMLSQRIAKSVERATSLPTTRARPHAEEAREAISQWRDAHALLRDGNEVHDPLRSPEIDAVYDTAGKHQRALIDAANRALDDSVGDAERARARADIMTSERLFLQSMEELVGLFQHESEAQFFTYIGLAAALLASTILGLLGQLVFLVRPLTWRIKDKQTLLEEQNTELTHAKERAEQSARATNAFLANMSHELRTPLNAVIGLSELLGMSRLNPTQQDHVSTIHVASKTLLALIADILDYTKIEATGVELHPSSVNPHELLEGCLRLTQKQADEKDLELELKCGEDLSQMIHADEVRLRQVIINLVTNAIKFTPSGAVTLSARITPSDEGDRLVISVTDTGIGIRDDQRAVLFESFKQVDNSSTREHGGVGLGLAISKVLVEAMGGHIDVESVLGQGTTFEVNIPHTPVRASTDLEKLDDHEPDIELHEHKVLLAEDNPINRKVALALLKTFDVSCDVANDGEEALSMALDNHYDIILMDIHMPKLNGQDVTAALREQLDAHSHPYVIAITANAMPGDRQRLLDSGFDDYVAKPMTRGLLGDALERAKASTPARGASAA